MDFLTLQKLQEISNSQIVIDTELERQQNKFAKEILNGLGNNIYNNIGVPVILTKEEKKLINKNKQNNFWKKIKNLFLGEEKNGTEIEGID